MKNFNIYEVYDYDPKSEIKLDKIIHSATVFIIIEN